MDVKIHSNIKKINILYLAILSDSNSELSLAKAALKT